MYIMNLYERLVEHVCACDLFVEQKANSHICTFVWYRVGVIHIFVCAEALTTVQMCFITKKKTEGRRKERKKDRQSDRNGKRFKIHSN